MNIDFTNLGKPQDFSRDELIAQAEKVKERLNLNDWQHCLEIAKYELKTLVQVTEL